MSSLQDANASSSTQRMSMDPFGWSANMRSRVQGIGGDLGTTDKDVVFHTAYQSFLPGPIEFDIRFENLTGTSGTFLFLLNELDDDGQARFIEHAHVPVTTLVESGGAFSLKGKVRDDSLYAVHCQLHGETDAAATGLQVTCDRQSQSAAYSEALEQARTSLFAKRPGGKLRHLVLDGPATMAEPVSQMCTGAQMDEPAYLDWVARMRRTPHRHRKQWEFVFIARVLEYYGALGPGRRGLGFGVGIEPLPAVFASFGCEIVATDLDQGDARSQVWNLTHQLGTQLSDLHEPDIIDNETFDRLVSFRPADMTRIPSDLRGFDFCWSSCAYEHLGSIQAGLDFVENSLETLKPGGIAVHTTELNLSSGYRTLTRGDTVLFRKRDMERLALVLSAKGHEVMPIRFDQGDQPDDRFVDMPPYSSDVHLKIALARYVTTSFGIVVRKKP